MSAGLRFNSVVVADVDGVVFLLLPSAKEMTLICSNYKMYILWMNGKDEEREGSLGK